MKSNYCSVNYYYHVFVDYGDWTVVFNVWLDTVSNKSSVAHYNSISCRLLHVCFMDYRGTVIMDYCFFEFLFRVAYLS